MIFHQIFPTNSLRKCIENSLENLYEDIGAKLKGNDHNSLIHVPLFHAGVVVVVLAAVAESSDTTIAAEIPVVALDERTLQAGAAD